MAVIDSRTHQDCFSTASKGDIGAGVGIEANMEAFQRDVPVEQDQSIEQRRGRSFSTEPGQGHDAPDRDGLGETRET